jgi:tetratricopeptide (TPR) repeat protein
MTFDEILAQVLDLLQREKRLSYRALKVRFGLDDEHLAASRDEIIEAKQLAVDDRGVVLVWTGDGAPAPSATASTPVQVSRATMPAYLAEKIRTTRDTLAGERKQVTVLFADIKDSTELIRGLDPEVAQRLLDPALQHMMDAVSLGAAYAFAGRMADALPLLDQTLERVAIGGHIMNLALVLIELSEALLLVGRVDEASALAERLRGLSRTHTGLGYQAHACRLLGDVAMRREPPDVDQAAGHYRQALALAEEIGMRPLQAHCHRGLGALYLTLGRGEQAHAALSTASALYRAMDMTFWLPQAEAMLAQVKD